MGDMNAKVGNGRHEDIVGHCELGEKNARGQTFIYWCTQHQQVTKIHGFSIIQEDCGYGEAQATGTEIKLTISPSIEDSGMPYMKQNNTRVQILIVITTYW